jgi:hypothetical protein
MRITSTMRNWLMAGIVIALGALVVASPPADADSLTGSQGTDTSLPTTESAVTVKGRGEFADLEITVNQTKNLVDQAVSITWKGAQPTVSGPGRFAQNFLQIFQCWGEADPSIPDAPGPPPEQCAFGAPSGVYEGVPQSSYPNNLAISRVISRSSWDNFAGTPGVFDSRTNQLWAPFRSVDGTEIGVHTDPDFRPFVVGGNYWLNPYFNFVTSNEIAAAPTGPDGRGAALFQVATGLENTGLGCGQRVLRVAGGSPQVPKCWIVVVPRSTATIENAGSSPFGGERADIYGVSTSPLHPNSWKNRIAIPIEFNPVDSPCTLGKEERRLAGNELALMAVASWQPALCLSGPLPPYSYASVGDTVARRQLTSPSIGSPGMVVVQRPIAADRVSSSNPVVYAPLSAQGIAIGFNVERNPSLRAPAEASAIAGVRVAQLNLTPRLVAKLLTQSYTSQVAIVGSTPSYDFIGTNPSDVYRDPDFLQFNPEFTQLEPGERRNVGGLVLPGSNSDAAQQVWEWILADPEARAWMEGTPDQWGMTVNPRYNIIADKNPAGLPFASPAPDSFPKADPYCFQGPVQGDNNILPPALCGTDWMPYSRGFSESAQMTRQAFDGARIVPNSLAQSPSEFWRRGVPQAIGRKSFFSMTDTASAARFGIQTARLSQAGDNGPNRRFIAADAAGLSAGLASMRPRTEPTVLEPVTDGLAPEAYPLTVLNYAAIAPLSLDQTARSDYAALLRYAAGAGQSPGPRQGQLPPGYQPLSPALAEQTQSAAVVVETMQPPAAQQPPPPAPAPSTNSSPPSTSRTPTTAPSSRPTTQATVAPDQAPTETAPSDDVAEEGEGDDVVIEEEEVAQVAVPTPGVDVPPVRVAVPVFGGVALLSALAALELTKRPRRRSSGRVSQSGVRA